MNFRRWSLVAGLIATSAVVALPAMATPLYPSEDAATQVCKADEVVWVDLNQGKFYHKAQANYGKSNNGGYACLKAARGDYRESHS